MPAAATTSITNPLVFATYGVWTAVMYVWAPGLALAVWVLNTLQAVAYLSLSYIVQQLKRWGEVGGWCAGLMPGMCLLEYLSASILPFAPSPIQMNELSPGTKVEQKRDIPAEQGPVFGSPSRSHQRDGTQRRAGEAGQLPRQYHRQQQQQQQQQQEDGQGKLPEMSNCCVQQCRQQLVTSLDDVRGVSQLQPWCSQQEHIAGVKALDLRVCNFLQLQQQQHQAWLDAHAVLA